MRDVKIYFTEDIFNYLDLVTAVLNLWLIFQTLVETEAQGVSERSMIKNWTALAVVLMWAKCFYWMNLFSEYSFYVRLVKSTLYDIRHFSSILIISFMMFANALMILNEGRYQDNKLVQEIFSFEPLDALMNQYMLAIGEFDIENYGQDQKVPVVWVLFVLSTFIS